MTPTPSQAASDLVFRTSADLTDLSRDLHEHCSNFTPRGDDEQLQFILSEIEDCVRYMYEKLAVEVALRKVEDAPTQT